VRSPRRIARLVDFTSNAAVDPDELKTGKPIYSDRVLANNRLANCRSGGRGTIPGTTGELFMTPSTRMIAALVLALAPCSVAQSQVTIDVAKITCDQYILFKVTDPRNIAIWMSGYYHGKRDNTFVDTQLLAATADKVKSFCLQKPQATVMQAVETVVGPAK
jgi:acid stress chaperone HdeB